MILLALIAIVLPLVLLMVFRLPARTTMIISMLVVAAIALAVWQMTPLS
jgi:L-lactate permease